MLQHLCPAQIPTQISSEHIMKVTHLSQKQRNLLCKVYTLIIWLPRPLLHDQTTTNNMNFFVGSFGSLFLVQNYEHIASRWKETLESLRSTTQWQRRCHKFCIFNEANKSFARPSGAFFISVHFFHVLGKSATWNGHISSFAENVNRRPPIWIFFPGFYTAPLNSVPG